MASTHRVARSGGADVVVDAPTEAVWRVVSDVTRTGEWSHECRQVSWLDVATAAPGARFRGTNRVGRLLRWSRVCEMTTVDAPHRLSWRTLPSWRYPDSTDWTITLSAVGSKTRIEQSYTVTKLSAFHDWLFARTIPTHSDRGDALAADLRRIGEVARRDSLAGSAS